MHNAAAVVERHTSRGDTLMKKIILGLVAALALTSFTAGLARAEGEEGGGDAPKKAKKAKKKKGGEEGGGEKAE
jgi:hypothetical protein